MAINTYWRSLYSDALLDLCGFQNRSLLKEYVSKESKGGDAVFFDEMSPSDDATVTTLSGSTHYRKDFESIVSPALSDWLAIQTPQTDITRQRTLCLPSEIAAGYTFRDKDEVAQGWSEESDVIRNIKRQIVKQEDTIILNALFASTQQRGKDQASLTAVSFPAGQTVSVSGTLTKEDINEVKKVFEDNYCYDEPIFMGITPKMKKDLIDNSGDKIHSKDFVDARNYFEKGELPDVYGVHLIVHPLISSYAGGFTNGRAVAWTPSAIKYNQSREMRVEMDQIPSQRFQVGLFMNEFVGACRRDDKRVVLLTLS